LKAGFRCDLPLYRAVASTHGSDDTTAGVGGAFLVPEHNGFLTKKLVTIQFASGGSLFEKSSAKTFRR